MDKTPKVSKFNKHSEFTTATENESRSCCTPVSSTRKSVESENDYSPIHIACTQEGCDVDVVWDWNSPQIKQRPRKAQKRLILPQSPKIPVKRYPSNNQIQTFERLREELQALREEIAVPDNEDSLLLSPVEERDYKYVNDEQNRNDIPPLTQEIYQTGNDDDLFNDSADEDLMMCTQRIEADLAAAGKNLNGHNENKDYQHKVNKSASFQQDVLFNSDSIANLLGQVDVQHLEVDRLNKNGGIKNTKERFTISRTSSENQLKNGSQVGKVEFHRTQSFESTVEYKKEIIPQHKLHEIEKKRKEAIAKLESKRKLEYNESPSKCSPDEIEQKRLQALAKLEAKRQQEFIERKRQEALKRLELSRKKNATVVKSSLSKRL